MKPPTTRPKSFHQELEVDVRFTSTPTADGPPNTPARGEAQRKRSVGGFVRKYFLEGQKLDDLTRARHDDRLPWHRRNRRNILAFLLPFGFFQLGWWTLAVRYGFFERYLYRYQMPITMVFGATSEGGGAVAFPVMTLLLELEPSIARDFSLMIQSCGMAASGMTVLLMGVRIEKHSVVLCSSGAFFSVILGLQFGEDLLSGPEKKMAFVSIWFSFAIALLVLNLQHKRQTFDSIPAFSWWKGVVLFGTGLIGGFLTALTGSGVDICSFCVLTLLFRVSEKVATPTSVVLMWLNTWVGFYWRELMMRSISPLAWEYFSVSVPVVVTMSPLGAIVASILHRQALAFMVYALETLSVIGFLLTRPSIVLVLVGVLIVVIGTLLFVGLSKAGQLLADRLPSAPPTSSTISGGCESTRFSPQTSDFSSNASPNSTAKESVVMVY
ncbi:hypothetical protein M3Y99_00262700 [Aphelenchoides fujianensis]|nr:hypothetical protein M3Y99_00262700 [Aphelenchoides fujianensis]